MKTAILIRIEKMHKAHFPLICRIFVVQEQALDRWGGVFMVFPSVVYKLRRIKPIKLQCQRVLVFEKIKRMGEGTLLSLARREVRLETENGKGR